MNMNVFVSADASADIFVSCRFPIVVEHFENIRMPPQASPHQFGFGSVKLGLPLLLIRNLIFFR